MYIPKSIGVELQSSIKDYFVMHPITDTHIDATQIDTCQPTDPDRNSIKYICSSEEKIRKFTVNVNEINPDFVPMMGDITDGANDHVYFKTLWDNIEIPNNILIGNHDLYSSTTPEKIAQDLGYDGRTAIAGSKFNRAISMTNAKGNVAVKMIFFDSTNGGSSADAWYKGHCTIDTQNWIASEIANADENIILLFSHHGPHFYDAPVSQFEQSEAFALRDIVNSAVENNPLLKVHHFFGHHHGGKEVEVFTNLGNNYKGYLMTCVVDYQLNWEIPILINKRGLVKIGKKIDLRYNYEDFLQ